MRILSVPVDSGFVCAHTCKIKCAVICWSLCACIQLVCWDMSTTAENQAYFGDTHVHICVCVARSCVSGSTGFQLLQFSCKTKATSNEPVYISVTTFALFHLKRLGCIICYHWKQWNYSKTSLCYSFLNLLSALTGLLYHNGLWTHNSKSAFILRRRYNIHSICCTIFFMEMASPHNCYCHMP